MTSPLIHETIEEMKLSAEAPTKPSLDLKRPLSWSAISSFEYSPEQWYKSYVLNVRSSSPELEFGSSVDKKIQDDPQFLPELPRYPLMQHKLKATLKKIPLTGIPDGLCLDTFLLCDYKTGKKAWHTQRADETGQLTMYLLLIYLVHKIPPEKFRCFIHWLPTKASGDFGDTIEFRSTPPEIITFETKRTMRDLLNFCVRIQTVRTAMQTYYDNHD